MLIVNFLFRRNDSGECFSVYNLLRSLSTHLYQIEITSLVCPCRFGNDKPIV